MITLHIMCCYNILKELLNYVNVTFTAIFLLHLISSGENMVITKFSSMFSITKSITGLSISLSHLFLKSHECGGNRSLLA